LFKYICGLLAISLLSDYYTYVEFRKFADSLEFN